MLESTDNAKFHNVLDQPIVTKKNNRIRTLLHHDDRQRGLKKTRITPQIVAGRPDGNDGKKKPATMARTGPENDTHNFLLLSSLSSKANDFDLFCVPL